MATATTTKPMTTMSMTTIPQTTAYQQLLDSPPAPQDDSCQISVPDYSVLRQQNISKINGYYSTLLESYTKNYNDFTTQQTSQNINDRQYANSTLKPKVADYNTQIINLSQALINTVNQDTDLIMEQKNQLQKKTLDVDSLMSNINLLKDKDTEMTVLLNSRNDSFNFSKASADDMKFMTYVYIGIDILLVLLVVGFIIYLVYSGYNNTSSNTSSNTKANNSYKNISMNNRM